MKHYLFYIAVVVTLSCNTIDVFEQTKAFPSHSWKMSERPSFTFNITDTASLYNIYLVLRHEDAYNYNNIWLNISMKSPKDSIAVRREFILADNTKGWIGKGMDDIFDYRMLFSNEPLRLTKGSYTFTLQQVMREDPLNNVINAGIRVERVK